MIVQKFINLYIPTYFNIILLQNKKTINIYIYNKLYFLKFNSSSNLIFINKENNNIKIMNNEANNKLQFLNKFTMKFLKSINLYFYLKIKFKGKGYKINFYKKKKLIKFFFGSSHIQLFLIKNIILKKISKYKFILKGVNLENLKITANQIQAIKKINPYTLRGIRLSKTTITRKKGRKGSWI